MTLNTETAALMAEFAKSGGKPLHEMTTAEARSLSEALTALGLPPDASATVSDSRLAVMGGDILLRRVTPATAPQGVIVFLHGGGWVIGSATEWTSVATHLATASGCIVVLPDYRMAPEFPFPTPVEDCWSALRHIDQTTALPLIVAGDSAGGNLAAVMALRARDQGGPALKGQMLIYPVTDYVPTRASWLAADNQNTLTAEGMTWFWDHYVAKPEDRLHPDVSPLRAVSHHDLPPAFMLLAGHDILYDEGTAYADLLHAAGNDLSRHDFDGDIHGFLTLGSVLPSAGVAITAMGDWVRQVLAK